MSEVIRFQFPEGAVRDEVEGDACLAIFSAECLHGRPQTLLEASYLVSADGRCLVLQVSGPAGETIVAGSDEESEMQEVYNKLLALNKALELAETI